MKASIDTFFSDIPAFTEFEGVTDPANYKPLPDDWVLALADIVNSTRAIEEGHYKDVNMSGASVISAVLNAVGRGDFPFVFSGDGAMIAVPGILEDMARDALAGVKVWVKEELRLDLRVALVPLEDIRRHGHDVRVARYSASQFVSYAMFAGGGTSWAEEQMKLGYFQVQQGHPGTRPDLTGLSCHWNPMEATNGEIVSIIVMPGDLGGGPEFARLVKKIISISAEQNRAGHPLPVGGLELDLSFSGIEREARTMSSTGWRWLARLQIMLQVAVVMVFRKLKIRVGSFDPGLYAREVAGNADFRKFDDGLKMTIDVDVSRRRRIEMCLTEAHAAGVARFGLHRQQSALVTCFVPTPLARNHIHFIDGAGGGYAVATRKMRGGNQ
ncbi:DUF3095 domain-containing protein [Dongia soli]|uniref:DUF3095 domain-containing protein n=1 Tax=Dongia soli TaxID=600628 RepID=A0ABU5EID6_9PROT|nr:DUF3095 domain-containing protein [Dongia soli]MDY0885885.1 DUF3095 domain-containing protein [Dongia soli]